MEPSRFDIPVGKDSAISRAALARKWGVSDRTMREIVARLRMERTSDPYAIISSSNGAGYWRSMVTEELTAYARERRSRGQKEYAAAGDAERVLKHQGQLSFL